MLLFKCQQCGRALQVDDSLAGQTIQCGKCGAIGPAPLASEPDCMLVYTFNGANEGMPITAEELQLRLTDGTLGPFDLVKKDGVWLQLSSLYELPEPPEPPRHDEQPEIALLLKDLAPIQIQSRTSDNSKKRFLPRPADFFAPRDENGKFLTKKLVAAWAKLIPALALIIFGALNGLRVVNASRNNFASVLVFNGTGKEIRIAPPSTGSISTEAVPNNSTATLFNLNPILRWRYKLTYEESGSGAKHKLTVPISPGHDTVVVLGDGNSRLLKEVEEFQNANLVQEDSAQTLFRQIEAREPLYEAQQLLQRSLSQLNAAVTGRTAETFFSDRKYNFGLLGISSGSRPPAKPARTPDDRPVLLLPGKQTLNFATGTLTLLPSEHRRDAQLTASALPKFTFKVTESISCTAEPKLEIVRSGNNLTVTLNLGHQVCKLNERTLRGEVKYIATHNGSENTWSWEWILTQDKSRKEFVLNKS